MNSLSQFTKRVYAGAFVALLIGAFFVGINNRIERSLFGPDFEVQTGIKKEYEQPKLSDAPYRPNFDLRKVLSDQVEAPASASLKGSKGMTVAEVGGARVTRAQVEEARAKAQNFFKNGQYAEALAEYLWLYDTGMKLIPSLAATRSTWLLKEIIRLADQYKPAAEALALRRDGVHHYVVSDPTDTDSLREYLRLNQALGDSKRNFELYESVDPDDYRKILLAEFVFEDLMSGGRYVEAATGRPLGKILQVIDAVETSRIEEKSKPAVAALVRETKKYLDVYLGSGRLDDAITLTRRVLRYDSSAETVATLRSSYASFEQIQSYQTALDGDGAAGKN